MAKERVAKERVDRLLVDRGLVETRTKAQALILAGKIYTGTKRIDKAGDTLPVDAPLTVKGMDHPWVSRGGLKLDHAIQTFELDFAGKTVIDVGSSTGGFTDVSLHHGATKVYSVDVGHGQLDWKLRNDPRVVVLEKTNARYLDAETIPEPIDVVVCDASFISLKTVLPAAMALTRSPAELVALIKPQFEAGREDVGKGGVVRDPAVHERVCNEVRDWLSNLEGWEVKGLTESPITGPEGNHEFLIWGHKAKETGA